MHAGYSNVDAEVLPTSECPVPYAVVSSIEST